MMQSPLLSSFSVGLTTGLVIESGDGVTWIVPIINGQIYHQAIQKLLLAGVDVNHNLKALLMREGINIESSSAEEIIKEIKEKNCYFVVDPTKPPKTTDKFTYPMPDGSSKEIPNHILYEAPEVMFEPSMLGYNMLNIPQALINSLKMISSEYWSELLSHIVLSGGNLSYSGFDERLKHELNLLLPELGPIPKSKKSAEISEIKNVKLEPIESKKKDYDTCPKCGNMIDLSKNDKYCSKCGFNLEVPEISIELSEDKEKKVPTSNVCPYCFKKIKDVTSIFCPYCGKKIEKLEGPTKVDKIIKDTSLAKGFTDSIDSSEIIKFYIPDNLQYAIFYGASILGSLPTFQALFVTYEEFLIDPKLIYKDISEIF